MEDAQHAGETGHAADFAAAGNILSTLRQEEDVGKGGRAGRGAQQDEVGRDAEGAAEADDAVVLREVGDEDADEDETDRKDSNASVFIAWQHTGGSSGPYMDRVKLK